MYIRTLQSAATRCRLTALSPRRPAGAEIADEVLVTPDWRSIVTSDCDAVIIATPPAAHAEAMHACLDVGKPCIVEKPLCLDLATAEQLHARASQSGIPVLVDHTHLFSATYRTLTSELSSAGEPIERLISEAGALGPFNEHTPALWDWCSHDFSLCLDLMGQVPDQLQALGGLCSPKIDDPEVVSVALRFPSGASGWIHSGRSLPTKRRSLAVFTASQAYVWDGIGAEQLLSAPIDFFRRYQDSGSSLQEWTSLSPRHKTPSMVRMLSYFVGGLEGGDRALFGTHLALEVVRLLEQSEQSMRRLG